MSGFERIKSATNQATVIDLPASADPSELFVARDGSDLRLFDVNTSKYTTIEPPGLARNEVLRGLKNYYPLISDTTDEAGAQNGSKVNNPPIDSTKGVELSKANQSVKLGNDSSTAFVEDGEDFTIAFWYTPKTVDTSGSDQEVFMTGGTNALTIVQSDDVLKAKTDDGDPATYDSLGADERIYVAVTHTSDVITLFINGIKKDTASFSENATGGIMELGNGLSKGEHVRDIGFWTRVLSNKEIKALYNEGVPRHDFLEKLWHHYPAQQHVFMKDYKVRDLGRPVLLKDATTKEYVDTQVSGSKLKRGIHAYYSFDETNAYADSIGVNDGSLTGTGGNIASNGGKIGDGFDTQGNTAYVDVGNGLSWTDGDFSVSLWVKPNQSNITFLANGLSGDFTHIGFDSSNQFFVTTSNNSSSLTLSSLSTYTTGSWYHVVVTRTGSKGNLYVESLLEGSGSNALKSGTVGDTTNGRLGAAEGSDVDVLIDEVGIWNRVLSESEVKLLYNLGNGTNDFVQFDWYDLPAQADVQMNNHSIVGVALKTNDNTAALTRKYLEDGHIKAALNMNSKKITSLEDASNNKDAVNLQTGDGRYLLLDGTNSMGGDLSMDDGSTNAPYKVVGLAPPSADGDAVRLKYLQDNYYTQSNSNSRFLQIDGTNGMNANLDMNNDSGGPYRIKNLANATTGKDALNQNTADGRFLRLDGSNSMGADLSMNDGSPNAPYKVVDLAPPSADGDAIRLKYLQDNYYTQSNSNNRFLQIDGTNGMNADLNMNNDNNGPYKIVGLANPGTSDNDAVNLGYLQSNHYSKSTSDTRFLLTGGTNSMRGHLDMNDGSTSYRIKNLGDATNGSDALNRNTADGRFLRLDGGNSMGADLSMNDGSGPYKITGLANPGTNDKDAVNLGHLQSSYYSKSTSDGRFLRLDGNNSMNGNIDMSGNNIVNINNNNGDPKDHVATQDDVNKWSSRKATENVDMNGNNIINVGGTGDVKYEVANKDYVQTFVNNNAGGAPETWSQFPATQDVDMNDGNGPYRIKQMADPQNDSDATTKKYVTTNAVMTKSIPTRADKYDYKKMQFVTEHFFRDHRWRIHDNGTLSSSVYDQTKWKTYELPFRYSIRGANPTPVRTADLSSTLADEFGHDFFFGDSGNLFFVIENKGFFDGSWPSDIHKWSLSTPYDVTTRSSHQSTRLIDDEQDFYNSQWDPLGMRLFTVAEFNGDMYVFKTSSAFDITTLQIASDPEGFPGDFDAFVFLENGTIFHGLEVNSSFLNVEKWETPTSYRVFNDGSMTKLAEFNLDEDNFDTYWDSFPLPLWHPSGYRVILGENEFSVDPNQGLSQQTDSGAAHLLAFGPTFPAINNSKLDLQFTSRSGFDGRILATFDNGDVRLLDKRYTNLKDASNGHHVGFALALDHESWIVFTFYNESQSQTDHRLWFLSISENHVRWKETSHTFSSQTHRVTGGDDNQAGVIILVRGENKVFSTDWGLTWIEENFTGDNNTELAFDLKYHEGTWIAAGTNGFIWRSTDDGTSWTMIKMDPNNNTYTHVTITAKTWVVAGYNGSAFYSTDDGNTWKESYVDVPATPPDFNFLYGYKNMVMAAMGDNVMQSIDYGASFELFDFDPTGNSITSMSEYLIGSTNKKATKVKWVDF
jgi:hypothetical protein